MNATGTPAADGSAERTYSIWYAGLLLIGAFFIYRGVRLGIALVQIGHILPQQILLCACYLVLGAGLIARKYWARAFGLVVLPLLLLFVYSIVREYPPAWRSYPVHSLAFMSAAAFIYLQLPMVERELVRETPDAEARREIAPPPRRVPFTLRLSVICGNPFMLLSWGVTGAVCCAIAYMLRKAGILSGADMPAAFNAAWVLLWVFFLAVIGYMAGRLAAWILSNDIRLLETGLPARAVLIKSEKMRIQRGGRPLFHLVFEYEAGGKKYRNWMDTPWPGKLYDEAEEPMLYDPAKPGDSILLDELPAHIGTDANGALRHRYPYMGFVYALVPLSVLTAMIFLTVAGR